MSVIALQRKNCSAYCRFLSFGVRYVHMHGFHCSLQWLWSCRLLTISVSIIESRIIYSYLNDSHEFSIAQFIILGVTTKHLKDLFLLLSCKHIHLAAFGMLRDIQHVVFTQANINQIRSTNSWQKQSIYLLKYASFSFVGSAKFTAFDLIKVPRDEGNPETRMPSFSLIL